MLWSWSRDKLKAPKFNLIFCLISLATSLEKCLHDEVIRISKSQGSIYFKTVLEVALDEIYMNGSMKSQKACGLLDSWPKNLKK